MCRQSLFREPAPVLVDPARVSHGMLPYQTPAPESQRVRSFGSRLKPRYIVGTESLDQ